MLRKLLLFLPLILFVLLCIAFALRLEKPEPAVTTFSPLLNKPFPTVSLPVLFSEDAILTNAHFAGKVVLVNVFASWCVSCNIEHPQLMKLAKSGRVPIYGLNWKDTDENARNWLAQHGNPYTQVGKDPDGRVAVELGITGAPESWLLDKNGTVIYHLAGPLTESIIDYELLPRIEGALQ